MIHAITAVNFKGESLRMELANPGSSGIYVHSVRGISAGEATISISNMATRDGGRFNSARVGTRNIVLTLGMLDTPSVEENRHLTYKYFPVKKPITLIFETDLNELQIEGYTEKNDVDIFSKSEQTQISILCPNPYFESSYVQTTNLADVIPLFEFPFSNEGPDPKIVMGEYRTTNALVVNYQGESDVGFIINIYSGGNIRNFALFNAETRQTIWLRDDVINRITGSYILKNDIIRISTVKGAKSITLQRGAAIYDIINALKRDSQWIELTQGNNRIGYSATAGLEDIQFEITNKILYEGV